MNSLLLLGRGGSSDSLLAVYWYHSTWREGVSHATAPHVTSTDTTDGSLINAEERWESSDTVRPPLTLSQWGGELVPHTLTSGGSPSSPHRLHWRHLSRGIGRPHYSLERVSIPSLMREMENWHFWFAGFYSIYLGSMKQKEIPGNSPPCCSTRFKVPQ